MAVTTIPTAGIADDAVGNTKLDLSENYAFTGTVTGVQDFVKISTNTISSAVGNTSFSGISDTYDIYMVQMRNVQFSADAKMKCRVGTSSSYITGNYRLSGTSGRADSSAIDKDNKFTDSTFDISGGWTVGGNTNENYNARVYFYNLRATTGAKHIYCNATFVNDGDYVVFGNWSGRLPSTDQYTHIQFGDLTGSANMDSGVFTLYGLKQ